MPSPVAFPAAEEFGTRVRTRRLKLRLTQEGLAERCGLDWTYVGQVERGQRNLTLRNILRLAKALEVNPAVLVKDLVP
jgi:transcriptional regulator with XRE-family HTH domain